MHCYGRYVSRAHDALGLLSSSRFPVGIYLFYAAPGSRISNRIWFACVHRGQKIIRDSRFVFFRCSCAVCVEIRRHHQQILDLSFFGDHEGRLDPVVPNDFCESGYQNTTWIPEAPHNTTHLGAPNPTDIESGRHKKSDGILVSYFVCIYLRESPGIIL